MAIDFSVQSLQFRRRNKQGKMTLRYVWDVVSRTDSPVRMLIESWGGKPDGYIRTFGTDLLLGKYLSGRIAKGAAGAADEDLDMDFVGEEKYEVHGPLRNLGRALKADNHEKAKLRLQITGAEDAWDEHACLNNTVDGIGNFDDDGVTCDQLNQAMASRVKASFKKGGEYATHIIAIDDFMTSAKDLSDVLGGEATTYAPVDRERISEIIQLADGLREKMDEVSVERPEPPPGVAPPAPPIPEPVIERGTAWGGWA